MATAHKTKSIANDLMKTLTSGALPGETDDFSRADRAAAAAIAQTALDNPKRPAIASETATDARGRRIMRIAIANDDMPFLVDSVAAAVAAHGVATNRILHPVVDNGTPTSLIYLETDRPDAKGRKALLADIETNLGHVRAAVRDWRAMQAALKADAAALPTGEGAALLAWLLERNMTLLGSAHFDAAGKISKALGIARKIGDALLSPEARERAIAWLGSQPRAADRQVQLHFDRPPPRTARPLHREKRHRNVRARWFMDERCACGHPRQHSRVANATDRVAGQIWLCA